MRILAVFSAFCCLFLAACTSGSDTNTLDPDKADSSQNTEAASQIEIPIGMAASRVLQLLGPADATDTDDSGRQMWRYSGKLAEYVYVSNSDGAHTLVIGKYIRNPSEKSFGLPLMLTLVFDQGRKVVNFNFAQIAF